MNRIGLGKGRGKGYLNLVPMDSHIHSLSAKGQKTFLQRIGIGKPKRGRPPVERKVEIYYGDMSKLGGLVKERKKKLYPLTKREKKISLATVGGAGVGFVVGGMTGGLLGIFAGVPIGTFVGNTIARKTIPQTGRKPYQRTSYLKSLWEDRQEIIREREDINAIERARAKSEAEGKAMGVYAKGKKRKFEQEILDDDYDTKEPYFSKIVYNEPKKYSIQHNIGKSKYVVNFSTMKKYPDGSPFYDMRIFKNKKDLGKFLTTLSQKGYSEV